MSSILKEETDFIEPQLKVGNICFMTYRYSVLYFLNLSLKHFFPTENGNFCENIHNRRPLSFRVLTCRACPVDVFPNRRQKTWYIVSASVCSIKGRHIYDNLNVPVQAIRIIFPILSQNNFGIFLIDAICLSSFLSSASLKTFGWGFNRGKLPMNFGTQKNIKRLCIS